MPLIKAIDSKTMPNMETIEPVIFQQALELWQNTSIDSPAILEAKKCLTNWFMNKSKINWTNEQMLNVQRICIPIIEAIKIYISQNDSFITLPYADKVDFIRNSITCFIKEQEIEKINLILSSTLALPTISAPLSTTESKKPRKNKRKKKKNSGTQAATFNLQKDKSDIWNRSYDEEMQGCRDFWFSLSDEERRKLVRIEKEGILKKMKEQQRHSCSCTVCGRKR